MLLFMGESRKIPEERQSKFAGAFCSPTLWEAENNGVVSFEKNSNITAIFMSTAILNTL